MRRVVGAQRCGRFSRIAAASSLMPSPNPIPGNGGLSRGTRRKGRHCSPMWTPLLNMSQRSMYRFTRSPFTSKPFWRVGWPQ